MGQPGYPAQGLGFFLNKFALKTADVVIPVSEEIAQILKKDWCLKNVVLIQNTFDKTTRKKSFTKKRKKITIISCTRIDKNKNVSDIIKALNILVKKNNNIELLIIGDGPELKSCMDLVTQLQIQN